MNDVFKWMQEFPFYMITSILPIFETTFLISKLKGKGHEPSQAENSSARATAQASLAWAHHYYSPLATEVIWL